MIADTVAADTFAGTGFITAVAAFKVYFFFAFHFQPVKFEGCPLLGFTGEPPVGAVFLFIFFEQLQSAYLKVEKKSSIELLIPLIRYGNPGPVLRM